MAADASARPTGLAPGGRPATGLMDLVRENLDAILSLQAGGKTWDAIARGLTKQGYKTSDGRELTGKHLTGIVSSVRRQAARRAEKVAARGARADVTSLKRDTDRRLALSPDLVGPRATPRPNPEPSEEALRRENLARLQDLIKKD